MYFEWDETKNIFLQFERGISFERVVDAIAAGKILDILEHLNKEKYPDQILIIVDIDNYACVVPAVISGETYFLKTAFRSRKYTKKYFNARK
ncbi:MAG: DUF4258 domain-containing protein [Chitinivibrionia bacterium]|nr:DUF4258 domain-containing protein [Chitinivibrionia bacterium]